MNNDNFQNSRYEYTTREYPTTTAVSGAVDVALEAEGWQVAWRDVTTEGTFAVYRRARPEKKRFEGYHAESDLPIKQGQKVTILKGTTIRTTHPRDRANGGIRIAERTYKVKVHHLMPGMTIDAGLCRNGETPGHKHNPSVCWPGEGAYWFEVDVNSVPEAQA